MKVHSLGRHRATGCFAAVAVAVAALFGAAAPAVAAAPATLAVVVVGSGGVVSKPAGIACPGTCTATFAAGTSVLLTPEPKSGSKFLRWGGSCTGTGACKVQVSTLTGVAAQFLPGPKPQPTTNKYVAVPGPYQGPLFTNGLSLFVAPGGASILNINLATSVNCVPSGGGGDSIEILRVAIQPNGSFSSKTFQDGIFDGSDAIFTYTFAGSFEPVTATAPASAAGTWREDITLPTGITTKSCTSNVQPWTATLQPEPPWHRSSILPGNYKSPLFHGSISFSVAPGATRMLNFSTGTILNCLPSGSANDSISIGEVAIQPNGSFTSETSQDGVFQGSNAKFTYTLAGSFEGTTPAGVSSVAGIFREDIVPTSGITKSCTTNNQFWTASLRS
jgi:hypothetical protein